MEICDVCHLGRLKVTTAPFLYQLQGQILIVSQAPAEICDVCDEIEYDAYFLEAMALLIREHSNGDGSHLSEQLLPAVRSGFGLRRYKRI